VNEAISLNLSDPLSFKIKAEICGLTMDYENVLENINKALDLDKTDYYSYKIKAHSLQLLERYDEALDPINESIQLNHDDHDSFVIKRECLFELKRYNEALVEAENAINTGNEELDINAKARILAKLKNSKEAVKLIKNLIEGDPENPLYYDTYGEILMWSKQFTTAIEKYLKAIELLEGGVNIDPEENFSHETYIKMGKCYLRIDKPEYALKYLEIGKELAMENHDQFWINKASAYLGEL